MDPLSVYCHIPFCIKRCHYCHFVTTDGQLNRIDDYIEALGKEVDLIHESLGTKCAVHTLFFGGGTPSLVPLQLYKRIFNQFDKAFNFTEECEISLEANPGTVNQEYLMGLRQIGFNRISIGAQSVHSQELAMLGRIHNAQQISQAVEWSRRAGFENINLDLMFGLPDQPMDNWLETLKKVTGLNPEHLSLYELTVEPGTPLERYIQDKAINAPDQDLAADMYDAAMDFLGVHGFEQYEISNWAVRRNGKLMVCRHNMSYWLNRPFIGLGVGAFGYAGGCRLENTPDIKTYIHLLRPPSSLPFPQTPASINITPLSEWDEIQETMMVGLRLTLEGVSEKRFFDRFGRSMRELFKKEINKLINNGLLEWKNNGEDNILRLTRKGRILGNQVFMEFVGLDER